MGQSVDSSYSRTSVSGSRSQGFEHGLRGEGALTSALIGDDVGRVEKQQAAKSSDKQAQLKRLKQDYKDRTDERDAGTADYNVIDNLANDNIAKIDQNQVALQPQYEEVLRREYHRKLRKLKNRSVSTCSLANREAPIIHSIELVVILSIFALTFWGVLHGVVWLIIGSPQV